MGHEPSFLIVIFCLDEKRNDEMTERALKREKGISPNIAILHQLGANNEKAFGNRWIRITGISVGWYSVIQPEIKQ